MPTAIKRSRALRILALAAAISVTELQPLNAEPPLEENPVDIQIHGFLSQGFIFSVGNNYLAKSKRGSFEFNEAGVNLTATLTDKLKTGLQLFSRDLGPIGNYDIKLDWFYVDYRHANAFGFRAGRTKLPFGLYNEFSDVDSARLPILLPQSVYPTQNRDFLLAQTGGEFYGYIDLDSAGALDYRIYGGTIFLETSTQAGAPFEIRDLRTPYIAGGRLLWETPAQGLRLGGSAQSLRLDSEFFYPLNAALVSVEIPAVLWVASTEYVHDNLILASEYSRWHLKANSSDPALFPEVTNTSERMYGLVGYRLSAWFMPGAYYALQFGDINDRSGRDAKQNDVAATLRFDINQYWLVKLEGHFVRGTAGLNSRLNNDVPRNLLQRNWGVMLLKTSAYF